MRRWRVRPATRPLHGAVTVPGDKSLSHRALLLGALASGPSTLRRLSSGSDVRATRSLVEALGVTVSDLDGGIVRVEGVGLEGLRAPATVLDCGNAGTALRLAAGVLVAQGFDSVLTGDASLSRRPMARITRPLRMRGARVEGVVDVARRDETAPLSIKGLAQGQRLFELTYDLPVASAQVKSALLLSGLFADGVTALREPTVSRDHTERMLLAMGAPVSTMGPAVLLDPSDWDRVLQPLDMDIPGDPSAAAFWIAAAHLVAGSRVMVRRVLTNPTRVGFLEVLRDQGGGAVSDPKGEQGGEPVANLHVGVGPTGHLRRGARVGGELAVRCIDEVPVLVAVAAVSPGESVFDDLAELRVKESDRVEALGAMLAAFGVPHVVTPAGLRVQGGGRVRGGAVVDSRGDHRVAMAAAVLALAADGETVIDDVACVATSDPSFAATFRGLGGTLDEE